jgi:hypothetical protein
MTGPRSKSDGQAIFPAASLNAFRAAYPDHHARLSHNLVGHPLLTRDGLAALATRLPETSMEYNLGTLPVGISPDETPANGLSVAETIRSINDNKSWIVLKNIERDDAYGALLDSALAELAPMVTPTTGLMAHREAFLFLSSPGSVTPFHMDPEHNILLQIEGMKVMNVFPASDAALVPPEQSEAFHAGGHRNLAWDEHFRAKLDPVELKPGDAVLMPVKAPHFVQNGEAVSISLSVTWRSERSVAEGELHSLNRLLRARGWPLMPVSRQPERQRLARLGYRILNRLAG